jgi:Glycosyl transferase family 2
MPTILAESGVALWAANLPCLTERPPLQTCQVCVVIPVCNEAEHLPAVLRALACQVDAQGQPVDPKSYEVLVLANNCSDDSAAIATASRSQYPRLNLHVIEITLPPPQACVGRARQLVMNEAYRRFSLITPAHAGSPRQIIASTDGDTVVSPTWIASMLEEFERGVDVVCGRILTQRAAAGIQAETSLYFLRYMAHRYLTAQIETFLDPLPHDAWPRHYQHFGANLAVLASCYAQVGGVPNVSTQEDVALYQKLQNIDAKIRHSPKVKVFTSARQLGRTSSGLAERISQLSQASRQRQSILVESPQLTEARILLRHQLRQNWMILQGLASPGSWGAGLGPLARALGLPDLQLRQALEAAPTFGLLLETLTSYQRQDIAASLWPVNATEISLANMHLRQRVQALRQQWHPEAPFHLNAGLNAGLKALQQIEPVPLFSLTY